MMNYDHNLIVKPFYDRNEESVINGGIHNLFIEWLCMLDEEYWLLNWWCNWQT